MTVRRKMSEILKELAEISLRDSQAIPSSEAAHAHSCLHRSRGTGHWAMR